jgi:hypothetical protein
MSEKIAFETEYKGFKAVGYWGEGAVGRVVVTRDGNPFKEFAYPAYKIFNIAAHWQDIVEGELEGSDEGYFAAGTDLLGGCVMPTPVANGNRKS